MAYHRMKPSFENETTDHFFLKADQHSADYGKASNLLFIGTILERKPVPTDISRRCNGGGGITLPETAFGEF